MIHPTALEVAQRALGLAERRGDGFQVGVTHERSLLSRFARSTPTQATTINNYCIDVLCVRDGHTATATTNRLDDEALAATAERAEAAARAAGTNGSGRYPGVAESATPPAHEGFDAETTRLDPERAGAALATAFTVAREHGYEAFGVWTAGVVQIAIASTAGATLLDHVTDAFMKVVCRDADGRSGYAADAAVAASALDPEQIARRAAAKISRAEPAELPTGTYPAVLELDAVGLLLEMLGLTAFNGLAHVEGRGALAGRLGASIAAAGIDLSDSPRHPATLPRAFDAEGVVKQPVALIEGGVARAVVHDRRSGALAGEPSTGHALEPGGSAFGPHPTNLVLAAGDAADTAELAAPIERGIYITRLWYLNPVREKETLLTGVTREGTFLIEDGAVTRPLRDVRITDSVLRILEASEALTREQRLVTEGEFYGRRFASGIVCPALRTAELRLTGTSAG